jgi:hypothetical protein
MSAFRPNAASFGINSTIAGGNNSKIFWILIGELISTLVRKILETVN